MAAFPAFARQMTGIDPEGIDLRAGEMSARLDFDEPVLTPMAARRALVALAETARLSPDTARVRK